MSTPLPVLTSLKRLARRDDVPVATKALELVTRALEMEEDFAIGEIAKRREMVTKKWIEHREAWQITK